MTRFARRNGVAEKKETKMKKEEATSWEKMFDDQKADDKQQHQSEDEETNEERKRKHESLSILEKKIEEDNLNNEMNKANKKLKTNDRKSSIMNEFGKYIDKEVLDDLDKMLAKKRISYEEYLESLLREGRSNRRRLDRQKERESNRVCFKCRKSGHMVSDCPESKQDSEAATGICYKCGSTEHSVNNCKVKVEAGSYPYAKCFICKEMGHISKQCPDNPRGLYPNGNILFYIFTSLSLW